VRIEVDVREGEREARRAGERFGRSFADGANREAGRSNLAEVLARQVEEASARVSAARRREAAAVQDVLAAEALLDVERAKGNSRSRALAEAEARLDTALRRLTATQGSVRDATARHGQAQSALQGEMARSSQSASGLSGALSRVGRDADDSGSRLRGFSAASRDADSQSKGFAASLATLGLAAKGLGLILKPNIYAELIPVILGAAAAAAELSGALLILPGVLTTAGLAFGTLKIATSGFGDALKAMDDPAKFAEALKKLSPSAASAAVAIQSLKGRFDQLRNSLQEKLFSGLDTEIRETGATMMSVLQPAMESIASSANRMVKRILQDFRSIEGKKVFGEIGTEGARAFDNISKAVAPLVRAFLDVASVGAKVLADITKGAGSAAEKFAAWVHQLKESGKLEEIMLRGVEAVKKLGTVVGNVFGIISSIMKASGADGQTFLDKMVQITDKVDNFFKSMQGQFALGVFFDLVKAIQVVVAELSPLGPAVLAVMGSVTRALQTAAPFVSPLAESFGNLVIAITPLIELAGQVAAAILSGLTVVMTDLKPIIDALVAAIQGFVTNALPGLKTGFSAAWTVAKPLLGILSELALVVLPPLGTAFGLIVTALGPFLPLIIGAAVASAAWGKAAGLLTTALKLLGPAMTAIKLVIQGVTIAFRLLTLTMLANPFVALAAAVIAIALLIYFHWDSIKAFLIATWEAIKSAASTVWQAITTILTVVWETVKAAFSTAWESIKTILFVVWETIKQTAISVWGAITGFFSSVWEGIKRVTQSVWNGITGFLSGVWNGIRTTAANVWNGITTVISGAVEAVRSTVSNVINSVVSFLGNAWNTVKNAVSTAWNAVVNAVSTGVNNVLNFVRALPGQILSGLGSLGSLLINAGYSMITGLLQGLQNAAGQIFNFIYNLCRQVWESIKSFFGIGSPSKLFAEAGDSLGVGLARGIKGATSGAVDAARKMATDVAKAGTVDLKTVIPQVSGVSSQVHSAFAAARELAAQRGGGGQIEGVLDQAERVVNNIVIHNPQAEKSSDSINRELRKFAALGGMSR
jgi:phage-related protein